MERRNFLSRLMTALLVALSFGLLGRSESSASPSPEPKPQPKPTCGRGYGPCKYRSCSCYKFDGKSNTCKCGHSFYDHQ